MNKTVVLAILDGWGIGPKNSSNPIFKVQPKSINYLKANYLSGALQASGIAVGLPWGAVGNSEVGHLTMGAGRVIYQHYPRISLAIQNDTFFKNKVLLQAAQHAKTNSSALNVITLLTEGNIHAAFDHLEGLVEFAKRMEISKLKLHLITDGIDSRPRSALELLARLDEVIKKVGVGVIASVCGRFYAMDRDRHFDRTQMAYEAMTGSFSPTQSSLEDLINDNYANEKNDDLLQPLLLGPKANPIEDGDAVIFANFREDRVRQIAAPFIKPDFDEFEVKKFSNLFVCTMTNYSDKFKAPVAFPRQDLTHTLGEILSEKKLNQLMIAETEKYAHVTYFFNGYRDTMFPGQQKILIPSKNVSSHDQNPEMMAKDITDKVLLGLRSKKFSLIVLNYANADMVAHTGNFNAALRAIAEVDIQLQKLIKECEASGVYLIVTADHGNVEIMRDPVTGMVRRDHDPSMVPIYILGKEFRRSKTQQEISESEQGASGILSDVAPTILQILNVPQPKEMEGQSLLNIL